MHENLIPFSDCKEPIDIVNELSKANNQTDSIEIINQKIATFNRFLDIHGYTPADLKKVKMMKEACKLLQS